MINLPVTELLAGLAEECTELAQAALKYRRALDMTNPTPISTTEAYNHLMEEIADVELYIEAMHPNRSMIITIKDVKAARWRERLNREE